MARRRSIDAAVWRAQSAGAAALGGGEGLSPAEASSTATAEVAVSTERKSVTGSGERPHGLSEGRGDTDRDTVNDTLTGHLTVATCVGSGRAAGARSVPTAQANVALGTSPPARLARPDECGATG
jgi:hypothetical protein